MRCPWCDFTEDRVVDSRPADGGATIRRRRECASCGRRFSTFERVEDVGLVVIKRDGSREPYDRGKVVSGLRKALTNRPVGDDDIAELTDRVEGALRSRGPEVTSQDVGLQVLGGLKDLDAVAYMRFASVYKDFQEITDFEHELGLLLRKRVPSNREP